MIHFPRDSSTAGPAEPHSHLPGCHKSMSLARLASLRRDGMQYVQPSPLRGRRMFLVLLYPERSRPVMATLQSCSKLAEWESVGKGQVLVVPSAQKCVKETLICVVPACSNIYSVASVMGLSWKWGFSIAAALGGCFTCVGLLFIPEFCHPVLNRQHSELSWLMAHSVTPGDSQAPTSVIRPWTETFHAWPRYRKPALFLSNW